MQAKMFIRAGLCAATVALVTACAPASYSVRNPAPSGATFVDAQSQPTAIGLIDNRGGSERTFSSGVLPAALTLDGAPFDAPAFLARSVEAELASRGVPAKFNNDASAFPRMDLKAFRMQNHRVNAYSPFVTFTFISADLETATGKKRLGVFVKRGKVPVWSFDEIVEPTLNQPLSMATKELAAKIAGQLYGARSSDAAVDQLVSKLGTRNDNSFIDVYALGFSNNPKAIETLAKLTSDPDEYVRIAAISSLGTLAASDKFDLLKSIYTEGKLWQDRAMAIKAIGDLDTPEAKTYLAEQAAYWRSQPAGNEPTWMLQVIGLYM